MKTKLSFRAYDILAITTLCFLQGYRFLMLDKRGNGTPKLALALVMVLIILLVIAFVPQVLEAILKIIRAIRGG